MTDFFEFCAGKYRIERDRNYRIKCFRYDERWTAAEDQFLGNKLLHCMLDKINELERVGRR